MYELIKSKKYQKAEKLLPSGLDDAITEMEEALKANPFKFGTRITKLTDFDPPYRFRIGELRFFYDVVDKKVQLESIRKRPNAYKKRK